MLRNIPDHRRFFNTISLSRYLRIMIQIKELPNIKVHSLFIIIFRSVVQKSETSLSKINLPKLFKCGPFIY